MGQYTGRERKRGAIAELVRVIRGGENRFLAFEGDLEALRRCRYLLALDADTGLLMDTAAALVGSRPHPLNRPVWDEEHHRVAAATACWCPAWNRN